MRAAYQRKFGLPAPCPKTKSALPSLDWARSRVLHKKASDRALNGYWDELERKVNKEDSEVSEGNQYPFYLYFPPRCSRPLCEHPPTGALARALDQPTH
jgi:hypothetical protein